MRRKKHTADMIASMTGVFSHYYLSKGAKDFHLHVSRDEETYSIVAEGKVKISAKDLQSLEDDLLQDKSYDTEHYYSELLESMDSKDLSILGTVVDSAKVDYDDSQNVLRIEIRKANA